MREYVLMTDSCCDLTDEMAKQFDLTVLPLSVIQDGTEYVDYLDKRELDPAVFYDRLRKGSLGSTSAANVSAFHGAMEPILEQGKDILCICFSSALSTTYQSAVIAGQELEEAYPGSKILVIDSKCASLGQGMLVYLAAREKAKGKSMEEGADFVRQTIPHLCHWFTVDDLHHLKRGGRVSAAAAIVGTMLQMKPILHVDDEGRLIPVSKVRGRKASIKALADRMEELVEDPSVVFISHGDCLAEAEELAEMVRARFHPQELHINYVGPVIGNHSGPGTMALFFLGKHR